MHLIHQLWKWSSAVCRSFKQKYQILISWRKINTAESAIDASSQLDSTCSESRLDLNCYTVQLGGYKHLTTFLKGTLLNLLQKKVSMAQASCQKEKKNIVVITSAVLPTFLHIAPVFKTKNINKSGAFQQSTSKNSGIFYHQSHFCTSLFTISVKRQAKHLLACLY